MVTDKSETLIKHFVKVHICYRHYVKREAAAKRILIKWISPDNQIGDFSQKLYLQLIFYRASD